MYLSQFSNLSNQHNPRQTAPSRRRSFAWAIAFSLVLLSVGLAFGRQVPKRIKLEAEKKFNTSVVVELLTAEGVGINAQEWSELFQEMDVQFTIRKSLLKEKPETTEQVLGTTLRDVHVVGRLDRDGSITFADRKFTTEDIAKIREWIADLKAYGAQGTPKGQPIWGLTKVQFEPLYLALSEKMEADLIDLTLDQAMQKFTVREKYPIRFSATATEYVKTNLNARTVRNEYHGLSEGTVLAAMLNEFDLGFHPRRTPAGKIELSIVKLGEVNETWPAGWPPTEELPKLRSVFFQVREVELTDEPLLDVVQAVGDIIELPILIDEHGLKLKKIDVRTKKVSHKKKKVILSAALKHVCYLGKCKYEYRMDEAGSPLLWLMPDGPPKEEK